MTRGGDLLSGRRGGGEGGRRGELGACEASPLLMRTVMCWPPRDRTERVCTLKRCGATIKICPAAVRPVELCAQS